MLLSIFSPFTPSANNLVFHTKPYLGTKLRCQAILGTLSGTAPFAGYRASPVCTRCPYTKRREGFLPSFSSSSPPCPQVLEPRRLAARAAATRMAAILGEEVGQTVGYRMRMDTKVSRHTRIEVVTDGILLRRLQGDPGLEGCAAVVLDEFHERSLEVPSLPPRFNAQLNPA